MDMMAIRRRVMLVNLKKSRLPEEYQEVEYIASSGTQYIDTGYVPSLSTKTRVIASFPDNSVTCMCGAVSSSTGYDIAGWGSSAAKWFMRAFTSSTVRTTAAKNAWGYSSGFHVFETDAANHYMSVDGIGETRTAQPASNFSIRIYLFARRNNNGNLEYAGNGCVIKEAIFTESDAEVRHFIPCYRKSDSEIGMYDLVGKQFYANSGTGVFSKGNDVN